VFIPISSTKTNRLASTCSATITLQLALKNSSRSSAPTVRFLREAHPLHKAPYGGVAEGGGRLCAPKSDVFERWWQPGAPLGLPLGALEPSRLLCGAVRGSFWA
jgi:hypothetical protein